MAQPQRKPSVVPTAVWQEWAKQRARQALPLARIHDISKKVKINVTQLILEERRGE